MDKKRSRSIVQLGSCICRPILLQRLMIEKELANYGHKNLERFERVARKLKKPVDEIREYFQRLGRDVELIQKGSICVPRYDALDEKRMATSQFISSPSITNIIAPQIPEIEADSESRKGMPWTEEEHTQFLLGLQECGKGEWRAIAKTFVKTRTGTQVSFVSTIPCDTVYVLTDRPLGCISCTEILLAIAILEQR